MSEQKAQKGTKNILSFPLRAATMLGQILTRRNQWLSQAGKTFDGDRDLYTKLGYKRNLSYSDYLDRYNRGGVANRVIEVKPKATWRNQPIVVDDVNSEEPTLFDSAWSKLQIRLKVLHYLKRLDVVSGIGQYAVLFIGARDGRTPEQPLEGVRSAEDIMYLAVYGQGNAEIAEYEADPTSPRFGLPKLYTLTISQGNMVGKDSNLVSVEHKVLAHWSRIIHVAEGLKEDEVFGTPRLEAVWNYCDDLDKVCGGSAEATWKSVWMGFQLDIDKELDLNADDEDVLADEVAEYEHGLSRFMRTKGIKITPLGSKIVDPRGMFAMLSALISGTIDVPTRILFGSERGQLASEGDERNFNGTIKERQKDFAEMIILRPFVDRMIRLGALPPPEEGNYAVLWPDIATLTAREEADVAARMAQAIEKVAKQVNLVVSPEEFRQKYLKLPAKVPTTGVEELEKKDERAVVAAP